MPKACLMTVGFWKKVRLFLLFFCCILFSSAFAKSVPEYFLKAVYLFHFTDFVTWPNSSGEESKTKWICVFGKNPFDNYLQKVVDDNAQDNAVSLHYSQDLKDISDCHILFISRSEKHQLSKIIDTLKYRPVLTVSDIQNFAYKNGMIGFVTRASKVRLVANLDAVKASSIKLSSKIIEIATVVRESNIKEEYR